MKNNFLYYAIVIIFSICGTYFLYQLYYYYPRNVAFDLVVDIPKPHKSFDYSFYKGCDYISSDSELMHRLVYWLEVNNFQSYDSVYVGQLSNKLDFQKYDYLITYHKELLELNYSPYLTERDGLYMCKQIPLIPTFDTVIKDRVYIYRIRKNIRFRNVGP